VIQPGIISAYFILIQIHKTMTKLKKSIIGRKYIPCDNSYTVNLTSSSNFPYKNNTTIYLAGTARGDEPKECIILTEPFKCSIVTMSKETYDIETMVVVQYKDTTHITLYYESCLVPE
jgi:hypothetical protein